VAVVFPRLVGVLVVVRRPDGARKRGSRLVGSDAPVTVGPAAGALLDRLRLMEVGHRWNPNQMHVEHHQPGFCAPSLRPQRQ
jgi:hypothetical protein